MGFSGSVDSFEHLSAKEVIIYTSNGCSKCMILKTWLEDRNADVKERNLADIDVMTDLVMKNAVVLSAPALEIEGTVFTEDRIFDANGHINTGMFSILKDQ